LEGICHIFKKNLMAYTLRDSMDERKKAIKDLEDRKKADIASIDALLVQLGEVLLPRLRDGAPEYRLFARDIDDSEEGIREAQAGAARLKQLDEDIRGKEQEAAERGREISLLYTRAGELVLEDPAFEGFAGPYRAQAETLLPKIQSLEGRLEVLGGKEDPNVFAWIGKNAQGMVLRSFLGRNKSNLQRIFTAAGEKYARGVPEEAAAGVPAPDIGGDLGGVLDRIGESRKAQAAQQAALALLKEERRGIAASFAPDGGAARKIQALERHIAGAREQLRALFLRYGRLAFESPELPEYSGILESSGRQLLDRAASLTAAVAENERHIGRLKASLAVDAEKAAVGRMERSIAGHRRRIAESEKAILELNSQIAEAGGRIEELSKLL
jgi:chromosome segregation ATPase